MSSSCTITDKFTLDKTFSICSEVFAYITTQLLTPLLSYYPIPDTNPDLKLSTSELKSLIRFATAQTHFFLFKGSFYAD